MPFFHEIFRAEGIHMEGNALHREAVRAVIVQQEKILMIYSEINGDYKLPGGGIDAEESDQEALVREVLEESGATISHIGEFLGTVIEYNHAAEDAFDLFKMSSRYYLCQVKDEQFQAQSLDLYEEQFGFQPQWVEITKALETNRALLETGPVWVEREVWFLEKLLE